MLDRHSQHLPAGQDQKPFAPSGGPARSRAEPALTHRAHVLEALFRFTDRLYRASSLHDAYEAALDAIVETLECKSASILRFDPQGVMRFVAWRGLSTGYRDAVEGHSPWTREDRDPEPIFVPDIGKADLPEDLRAILQAEGISALAFIPLMTAGHVNGKFMAYYTTPQDFGRETVNIAITIARQLGFSLERARAEEAQRDGQRTLRESERRLSQELAATRHLQEISGKLSEHGDPGILFEQLLDAAVTVMRSDFASMQMLYPDRGAGGELRLMAFHGFSQQAARFWEWVGADSDSTCGAALRTRQRVIATDVDRCDFMAGTADLACYRQAGIRAVQTTPLISRSGRLLGMISTHWRSPHEPSAPDLQRFDVLARQAADMIDAARASEALRLSEERLRAVFNTPDVGVAVLTPDGRFVEANEAFSRLCGFSFEELNAIDSMALTHPDDRPLMQARLDEVRRGERSNFVIEKRYVRKDGSVIWVQNSVSLTHDESGRPLHLVKLIQNITERKVAERRQRLLIDEINHRVKNTLATVQSFASQSLRNASSLTEGRASFEARLIALSKSHDVLTRQHWEGADLTEVVNEAIAPYRGRGERERFRVEGEKLRLRPKAVLALSLAFHELATNAVKYGALSNDSGGISIDWRVIRQSRQFELRWQERDGPAVTPPVRRGFGSRLVEQGLSQDIAGDVRLNFNDRGLVCSIDAPLHEVAGTD